jgi:hypothetical protein
MPFEQELSEELKVQHNLAPSFDVEARAGLSQKGFVASFGSLRPTLAVFYALSTSSLHSQSDWEGLEDAFETIVLLDPYNPYYWDIGAWHMGYNASSASKDNDELPPLRRQSLAKSYLEKGDHFYDRGILANPDSYDLRMAKARLWSRPTVNPDYSKVAKTLERVLQDLNLPEQQENRVKRNLFYALLRVPEKVNEAYVLGRELYETPQNRVPSLVNGLCVLQMHPRMEVAAPLSLAQLYGDRATALKLLRNYFEIEDEYKPMYGVEELLAKLEAASRPENK